MAIFESYINQDAVILDSILSKQTSHGIGGTYLFDEKRFKLYQDRIEYGNTNITTFKPYSIIKLQDVYQVINDVSTKKLDQFIIKLKNGQKLLIKATDQGLNCLMLFVVPIFIFHDAFSIYR